ncbi:MAG: SET domain-containing protein [Elusimicrobia bacterium]|nr:SET domain-containing protein [Elusimicrobiota bacterium]
MNRKNKFHFRANWRECIDGSVVWNLGRHANHSCSPNARSINVDGEIWLCSLRPIMKGEEITFNFSYSFRDNPGPSQCKTFPCIGIIKKWSFKLQRITLFDFLFILATLSRMFK